MKWFKYIIFATYYPNYGKQYTLASVRSVFFVDKGQNSEGNTHFDLALYKYIVSQIQRWLNTYIILQLML